MDKAMVQKSKIICWYKYIGRMYGKWTTEYHHGETLHCWQWWCDEHLALWKYVRLRFLQAVSGEIH